jgi:hypothetical protein
VEGARTGDVRFDVLSKMDAWHKQWLRSHVPLLDQIVNVVVMTSEDSEVLMHDSNRRNVAGKLLLGSRSCKHLSIVKFEEAILDSETNHVLNGSYRQVHGGTFYKYEKSF